MYILFGAVIMLRVQVFLICDLEPNKSKNCCLNLFMYHVCLLNIKTYHKQSINLWLNNLFYLQLHYRISEEWLQGVTLGHIKYQVAKKCQVQYQPILSLFFQCKQHYTLCPYQKLTLSTHHRIQTDM